MGPGDSGSPNLRSGTGARAEREEEERGRDAERAQDLLGRERRGSPTYDEYPDSLEAQKKGEFKSLASYDFWAAGSQALKNPTSDAKAERVMSPYGDYDMDDSSFFARTTRLNVVGPSSTQIPRRRSSSAERLLINCGERTMVTSFQQTERSRSPSPIVTKPVLVLKKPDSPTESYLTLSLQPSLPLTDSSASRKLLVLDLNGTLLLRSSHSSRRAPAPPYSHPSRTALSSVPHPYLGLRTTYPRPYIPSFRAYLFHPTTLQWLDTMVWSSAQPHSVNDMVDKCFGSYKVALKAVWARDTLGLSNDEYHKKTQTTKDLAKPWAQIPSLLSSPCHSQPLSNSDPSVNSSSEVATDNNSSYASLPQQHSALTTILMDDSPLKAILQPWNHLCVPEYETKRRKLDVDIAERDLERMWLAEREDAKEISSLEATAEERMTEDRATNMDLAMKPSEANDVEDEEAERKRKHRQEKKILKKESKTRGKKNIEKVEEESYDETLLAVIGILDRLKHEGNVAGWMRSGGLIHVAGDQETILQSNGIDDTATPPSDNAETEMAVTTTAISIPSPPTIITSNSPLTPGTKRDCSSMSISGPYKRRRLTRVNGSSDTDFSVASERTLELNSDSEMVVPIPTTTRKIPSMSLPPSSWPSSPLSSAQAEQVSTGIPLVSVTASAYAAPSTSTSDCLTVQSKPLLWYETPAVVSYWAQHGRMALAELEIEIVSGVIASNQNAGGQSSGV